MAKVVCILLLAVTCVNACALCSAEVLDNGSRRSLMATDSLGVARDSGAGPLKLGDVLRQASKVLPFLAKASSASSKQPTSSKTTSSAATKTFIGPAEKPSSETVAVTTAALEPFDFSEDDVPPIVQLESAQLPISKTAGRGGAFDITLMSAGAAADDSNIQLNSAPVPADYTLESAQMDISSDPAKQATFDYLLGNLAGRGGTVPIRNANSGIGSAVDTVTASLTAAEQTRSSGSGNSGTAGGSKWSGDDVSAATDGYKPPLEASDKAAAGTDESSTGRGNINDAAAAASSGAQYPQADAASPLTDYASGEEVPAEYEPEAGSSSSEASSKEMVVDPLSGSTLTLESSTLALPQAMDAPVINEDSLSFDQIQREADTVAAQLLSSSITTTSSSSSRTGSSQEIQPEAGLAQYSTTSGITLHKPMEEEAADVDPNTAETSKTYLGAGSITGIVVGALIAVLGAAGVAMIVRARQIEKEVDSGYAKTRQTDDVELAERAVSAALPATPAAVNRRYTLTD